MRIVLIGDLHFFKLMAWPWELAGKRALGQMNLWFNRRFIFKVSRLAAVIERVDEIKPDLLLFSGDLTTTAMDAEFRIARDALSPLLKAYPAVIVPGNHDRYSFASARKKRLEAFFPDHAPSGYPYCRKLGDGLHLIALDPTKPNVIGDRGRLGARQLDATRTLVGGLPAGDRVIVLCHYTLGAPPSLHAEHERHAMTDADELRTVLAESEREVLYLHGHVHTPFCWRLPEAENVVAVNAGAPLMHDGRWPNGQGFWEVRVSSDPPTPWTLIHHGHGTDGQWLAEPAGVPTQPGGAVTFSREEAGAEGQAAET